MPDLKATQIVAAPWMGDSGMTYSILMLGTDGVVYRYDARCNGWVAMSMKLASCETPEKAHKR